MDMMALRRGLLMAMASGSSMRMDKGTFIPSSNYSKITIYHSLGVVPKFVYCIVRDDGVSQTTGAKIAYMGTIPHVTRQIYYYSKNGIKMDTAAWYDTDTYRTTPTDSQVFFGGTSGTPMGWSTGFTYDWYALAWEE